MEEIKKYWNSFTSSLNPYSDLKDERKGQLNLEHSIDERLKRCDCQGKVNEYLFKMREFNRLSSRCMYDDNFMEYPGRYKEYIYWIERINKSLENSNEGEMCNGGIDKALDVANDAILIHTGYIKKKGDDHIDYRTY